MISFSSESLRLNSVEEFCRLRESGKVVRIGDLSSYLVTGHACCARILKSRQFGVGDPGIGQSVGGDLGKEYRAMRANLLIFMNSPQHHASRKGIVKIYQEKSEYWNELIVACFDEVWRESRELREGTWDLMPVIIRPFVGRVIQRALDLPDFDLEGMFNEINQLADTLDPLGEKNSLRKSGLIYHRVLGELDAILGGAMKSGQCPFDEGVASEDLFLLLAGSIFTTGHLIGLATHDYLSGRLVLGADQVLARNNAEELIRYYSPVQMTRRVALCEVEVDGRMYPKNTVFWLSLAAANRDPEVFSDPNDLILSRKSNPHLALGAGEHFCIGAHLARLQLQGFFNHFSEKADQLQLVEGGEEKRHGLVFSGIDRLLVKSSR